MRVLALLAAAVFACACFKQAKPPPPPPSLTAALEAADSAVTTGGAVGPTCEKLAMELSMFSSGPGMPVMTSADLHRLGMDIAAFGATNDSLPGQAPPNTAQWQEIRAKLDRVLKGENPKPGPRYSISMPAEVKDAIDATDAALAAGDVAKARLAMGRARYAIGNWAEKMPGPRGVRMMQVVEEEYIDLAPAGQELEHLKSRWAQIRKAIEPASE